jgi:predicted dehydrogenase
MTIKIGIIGAGAIARHRHLPETRDNPFAEVGAVCDVVRERAEEMTVKYGGKAYTDYQEMLADEDIDAVIVAATNTTHAKMTIAALEAGKHVLCEKPMATTLEDAQAMMDAAERAGMKLMIAQNQRLEDANKKAKEILQSGKLGKVYTFRAIFGHPGCEDWAIDGEDTWFFRREITGLGTLGDLAVHKLDLIRWLLDDEYTEASAFVDIMEKTYPDGEPINVEDNAICLLRTQKGAIGTMVTSWTYRKEDNTTYIYCENGVLSLYAHPDYPVVVDYDHERAEYHKVGKKPTNVEQVKSGIIDAFVDCIVNDTEPLIPGIEGYKALEVVLACQESAETGQIVKINSLGGKETAA